MTLIAGLLMMLGTYSSYLPSKCTMLLLNHFELHFLEFLFLRFVSKPEQIWKVKKYIYRILPFRHIYIKNEFLYLTRNAELRKVNKTQYIFTVYLTTLSGPQTMQH